MSPIDEERMTVALSAVQRLLHGLKTGPNLKGKALKRMKLIEEAAQRLEVARIV